MSKLCRKVLFGHYENNLLKQFQKALNLHGVQQAYLGSLRLFASDTAQLANNLRASVLWKIRPKYETIITVNPIFHSPDDAYDALVATELQVIIAWSWKPKERYCHAQSPKQLLARKAAKAVDTLHKEDATWKAPNLLPSATIITVTRKQFWVLSAGVMYSGRYPSQPSTDFFDSWSLLWIGGSASGY